MSLPPNAQTYFTGKGFCAARGCVPIVIELDAPPVSLFLPGTGNA